MGLIRYLLNNPQLLIVLFFVVGPVVRAIYEHLKRQAQARQAEVASERARIEALRTGGRREDDALPAGEALEQRASQRRGMASGPVMQGPQPVPGRVASGTPGRPSRRGEPQPGQPAKKRRRDDGTDRRGPRVPGQVAAPERQPMPADRAQPSARTAEAIEAAMAQRLIAEAREQRPSGPSSLQRQAASNEEAARAAAGVALAASVKSNAHWRRAIVLQELLMPPVSMRGAPHDRD
jgi:hypothetical protein